MQELIQSRIVLKWYISVYNILGRIVLVIIFVKIINHKQNYLIIIKNFLNMLVNLWLYH